MDSQQNLLVLKVLFEYFGHFKNDLEEFETGKLESPLLKEIEHQNRLIKDEKLNVERINEEYSKLLREQNISIEAGEDGTIKLVVPKEGHKFIVSFDPAEVADSVNSSSSITAEEEDFEEEGEREGEGEEAMENFEDEEDDVQPYTINIEIQRSGLEKTLNLQAEVTPSMDGEGYEMYLTDLVLNKTGQTYAGPSFDTLDDSVREKFEEFANKNFKKLLPFIADYARAKEANLYQEWLQDVKSVVAN